MDNDPKHTEKEAQEVLKVAYYSAVTDSVPWCHSNLAGSYILNTKLKTRRAKNKKLKSLRLKGLERIKKRKSILQCSLRLLPLPTKDTIKYSNRTVCFMIMFMFLHLQFSFM